MLKMLQNRWRGLNAVWRFENRWQLFISRFLFRRFGLNVYRYKSMEILIDHDAGDENGARLVLTSPMYQRYMPFLDLRSRVNVLDLGAHVGGFPLMLRANEVQIKKLVCVELNPNTFSRLRFNIEHNLDCESALVNGAVCGSSKTLSLFLGQGQTSDSIYHAPPAPGSREYQVEGYTFDQIYEQYFAAQTVDICKMDIEGAESEVLRSGACTRLAKCRYLLIELHTVVKSESDEMLQRLAKLGFVKLAPAAADESAVFAFRNTLLK